MPKTVTKTLVLCLALASTLGAQEFKLGSHVSDFQVRDLDGKPVAFSALKGPLTVVTFIATESPVSNSYNQRMSEIYRDYATKNVKFIFVNANRSEPASEVREHAKRVGFPFAVYKDPDNVLADRFDAQVTPESFVIDSAGIIRYHGAIDDNMNEARVRTRTLRAALDALLEGKQAPSTETKAFGCTIKRVRKAS
ncbi:MAG: redoxin domain-containing protein [Bryobacteraceae bacterium]